MKFIVYGKSNCKYCNLAKNLLIRNNLEHTYLEVQKDITKEELEADLEMKVSTVPQIVRVDQAFEYIGGYDSLVKYLGE